MPGSLRSPLAGIVLLLASAVVAEVAADPAAKQAEVNGVRLPYVEQGSGTPVVLVHGAISDLRNWEPVRDTLARNHRFVAYTQRYHGTAPWPDDGNAFSAATNANDLAGFITSLNSGPVHLVGWSYGAVVAAIAAANNPHLIRSLVLYEPGLNTVLAPDGAGAKQAAEDAARMFGPAVAAMQAGDNERATFRLVEGGGSCSTKHALLCPKMP
jgi:pimeloyl-ACP methyl ester carboxylesterase